MNIAAKNQWFRNFLNQAAINFCDGDGVRLAGWIMRKKIVQKITYNRWIWELANVSEKENFSWYLLGSTQESLEKAVKKLKAKYPKLNIVGYHNGYLKDENKLNVLDDIRTKKPDILCLGMGMPLQEKFLVENSDYINYKIGLTGGAVFDYISGEFKMTPNIFYDLKLEWFYRFLQQPKRLFNRYFIGIPEFLGRIIVSFFVSPNSKFE
jgi:N-acetylglucosaminyldiphosphoundecaprenol N-acetyl-beta-D-mannosaminyltransferase